MPVLTVCVLIKLQNADAENFNMVSKMQNWEG